MAKVKASVRLYSVSIWFIVAAVVIAAVQLMLFDRTIARSTGWTDGQAASWTVFNPIIDVLILLTTILFITFGTYFKLEKVKLLWLRLTASVLAGLASWLVFYIVQLAIQHHLSHFNGV